MSKSPERETVRSSGVPDASSLRVLFCPAHYWYDNFREGSELSWAYNIADRIAVRSPGSVVVTGRSVVDDKPYRILELTPGETSINFGLTHALTFNTRYTIATFRALRESRFDLVHHLLPFAVGKTYSLAALWHGGTTPFVIGPVQTPLGVMDADLDASDFKGYGVNRPNRLGLFKRVISTRVGPLASNVIAPLVFSQLFRRTLARAAAVVAVNEDAKSLLLRSCISPSRVVVIPPGVDTNRFRPLKRQGDAERLKLLVVCQLIDRKNVDLIIRAFARVARAAPEAKLRIVGDGPQREALRVLAGALNLDDKVTFVGAVPNGRVHEEYQRADVFVNASADEAFATTSLEAIASALPVVSTRVGGFTSVVADGRTGYLLESTDPDEFAASLQRLAESRRLIDELSRHARALAEREFDWETAVIPKYRELYERVIGQGKVKGQDSTTHP